MTTENTFEIGGDLRVNRMGFGAMRLPVSTLHGPANDRDTGLKILRRAVELGVDHIDTAAFYYHQDGLAANEMIRAALSPYPSGLVIATKVGPYRGRTTRSRPASCPRPGCAPRWSGTCANWDATTSTSSTCGTAAWKTRPTTRSGSVSRSW